MWGARESENERHSLRRQAEDAEYEARRTEERLLREKRRAVEEVRQERDGIAHDLRHVEQELDLIKQFVQEKGLTAELAAWVDEHGEL